MVISFRHNNGKKVKDASKPASIYFRYSDGRNLDFRVSTKQKVLIDDWDTNKQRVKNRVHILNKDEINSYLSSLESYFEKEPLRLQADGVEITYNSIKRLFDTFLKVSDEDKQNPFKVSLSKFIEGFIEKSKTRISMVSGTYISKGTIKTYKTFQNSFEAFCNQNYKVDFDDVTLDFYHDYIEWCEKNNLSLNYIGKQIKTLKAIMINAVEEGVTDNLAFKSKRFKVLKEETDSIYLNMSELDSIYHLDLSDIPRLDRARDLFIIGSFTGLRVSDYNYLNEGNFVVIDGKKLIKIEPQKTKKKSNKKVIHIPLHPFVLEILSKYDNTAPLRMPEQHINECIKEVGKIAGINEVESHTVTRGGKEVTVNKPKHEFIQTHTARRSFCTNAYHLDMNMLDIMAISGHTSEKNFLNYIKVTSQERALKLSNHVFFNPKLKVV